ncbi:MAG: hypothetical protein DRH33_06145 [Candidatus Nealsonbacteria bacterium]|nr:MAG: hypothetical protein DRH33_06145 [Candidatus Nealsonbacteria bacterium]
MGFFDIFWIFFMISMLQPLLRQQWLNGARQRLIYKIERKRNSRVVILIHRQETMSFLGFPFFRYIDITDSEEILRAIELTDPEVPIDIVMHTPGGLVLASVQIARALQKHKGGVRVIVPHYAMSGGALIALAANEIIMSPNAVLGPVDPQLGQYPAASIISVVKKKPIKDIDDHTLIMADMGGKAIKQVEQTIYDLLSPHHPKEKAKKLAKLLSVGTWTHDYPITYEKAKELGLKVNSDIPPEFLQLMRLYPQPVRRQPSVEYIPFPRHKESKS